MSIMQKITNTVAGAMAFVGVGSQAVKAADLAPAAPIYTKAPVAAPVDMYWAAALSSQSIVSFSIGGFGSKSETDTTLNEKIKHVAPCNCITYTYQTLFGRDFSSDSYSKSVLGHVGAGFTIAGADTVERKVFEMIGVDRSISLGLRMITAAGMGYGEGRLLEHKSLYTINSNEEICAPCGTVLSFQSSMTKLAGYNKTNTLITMGARAGGVVVSEVGYGLYVRPATMDGNPAIIAGWHKALN